MVSTSAKHVILLDAWNLSSKLIYAELKNKYVYIPFSFEHRSS